MSQEQKQVIQSMDKMQLHGRCGWSGASCSNPAPGPLRRTAYKTKLAILCYIATLSCYYDAMLLCYIMSPFCGVVLLQWVVWRSRGVVHIVSGRAVDVAKTEASYTVHG